MHRVFISPHPFSSANDAIESLRRAEIPFLHNRLGRKMTTIELGEAVGNAEVLVASTEPLDDALFAQTPRLKLIVRAGIGLDNVDFAAAKKRGIRVAFTPDAPSRAVSELTIGLMLNLLRGIHLSNGELHRGGWHRHLGRRLEEVTVGVLGAGRIGAGVIARLSAFGCKRILAHDIRENRALENAMRFEWVDRETLFAESDVLSLHVPLTTRTRGLVDEKAIRSMKRDAFLINTSRGPIVDEAALLWALSEKQIAGAALDVFEQEPYMGPLSRFENCLLTAHMGSMSIDCRIRMEREAIAEVIRFLRGEPLHNEVTSEEG